MEVAERYATPLLQFDGGDGWTERISHRATGRLLVAACKAGIAVIERIKKMPLGNCKIFAQMASTLEELKDFCERAEAFNAAEMKVCVMELFSAKSNRTDSKRVVEILKNMIGHDTGSCILKFIHKKH